MHVLHYVSLIFLILLNDTPKDYVLQNDCE